MATPCPYIGPVAAYCSSSTSPSSGNSNGGGGISQTLDPLAGLAHSTASGAAWVVTHLGSTLDHGAATIDLTSSAFVTQYAIAFGAATFLTLLAWMFGVIKRVVRGVPAGTAIGEAIGFLWMTVLISAFTPLALTVVISAVDGITSGLSGGSNEALFGNMATALKSGTQGGGPIISILASLATIVAAGALWLEFVLRSVAIMVGAVFGPVVFSGMVDRALWSKVRRWVAMMGAVILLKPIVVIALSIGSVYADSNQGTSIVITGLAVIVLAVAGSGAVFKFIPGFGDDVAAGIGVRAVTGGGRAGVKAAGSAAGWIAGGIKTHGDRSTGGNNGGQGEGQRRNGNNGSGVTAGIQAHSTRGEGGGRVNGARKSED
ncbi:hypothetical protein ACEZDB_35700 [Streptacidiphilus sp. N1-3]|uniref:TrbL/VirB6 plasmid conjugal transfer protein n=1 Tax=Streptacidiphilus alkalitolerans TaxID=3342712 RepID=A0ABV6XCP2_9ACTN